MTVIVLALLAKSLVFLYLLYILLFILQCVHLSVELGAVIR